MTGSHAVIKDDSDGSFSLAMLTPVGCAWELPLVPEHLPIWVRSTLSFQERLTILPDTDKMGFEDAKLECEKAGGTLPMIRNQSELDKCSGLC